MMAVEGPFLAAIIARLPAPEYNLAAYGVAFAFALLVEAPVIMLMSASTALVEDATSYRRLRNFTHALNAGSTALLPLVLAPPVYDALMRGLIGLPDEVASLTWGALWLLLPWPGAIGYRRFYQGLLIRAGRTRAVAIGTVLRLAGMATTGVALYAFLDLPGAWVGAASLSAGVCVEAVAARLMAAGTVAEVRARMAPEDAAQRGAAFDAEAAGLGALADGAAAGPAHVGRAATDTAASSYRGIAAFYWPLALTSLIGLTVQPMLTFFMGRAPMPLESLAVFPVVHALSFLFRALGLSFQEAAIALLGRHAEHWPAVGRFALWLALASSGGLALVAFTPIAGFWFETVSGLTPGLAAFARAPTMILVPLPGLSVLLSLQRALLVVGRTTRHITTATAVEVACVAVLFAVLGWTVELVGVTAAFLSFLGGRLAGNLYLLRPVARTIERLGVRSARDG